MKMKMNKIIKSMIISTTLLTFFLSGIFSASAVSISGTPYEGYEYNHQSESIAAPLAYTASSPVFGAEMILETPIGVISSALYWSGNPEKPCTYILDAKNGRIISLDEKNNIAAVYEGFQTGDNKPVDMDSVRSFAVNGQGDRFALADPNAGAVYVTDFSGQTVEIIDREIIGRVDFKPQAVVFDNENSLLIADAARTGGYYEKNESNITFNNTGGHITALYYNTETRCVYALDAGRAILLNLTDTEEILLEIKPDAQSVFVTDTYADFIFIGEASGKISRLDANGTLEKEWTVQDFTAISYNGSGELLTVFGAADQSFEMTLYNTKDELVQNMNLLHFSLNQPADMLFDGKDSVYLLDSGNGRILILDKTFSVVRRVIASFVFEGELLPLNEPEGIALSRSGDIIIADTGNYRVLIGNKSGVVRKAIHRPDEALFDTDAPFRATKVMVDRGGKIYVIADTINLGIMVFTPDGEFVSFFGANKVTRTADVLFNYIRKKFLTREQMRALQKYTPVSIVNAAIDDDGFIYALSAVNQTWSSDKEALVQRLNYLGGNALHLEGLSVGFGDLDWNFKPVKNTEFVDIDVDSAGFINVVDGTRKKIFQYSPRGQMTAVFGGEGTQAGAFTTPSAIVNIGESMFVLDKHAGSITEFHPTEYVKALHRATILLDDSDTEETLRAWSEVIRLNTNSQYAYYGLGLSYEMRGEYKLAMDNFRLAHAKVEYSKAMREYRKTYMAENFWWIAVCVIVTLMVIFSSVRLVKKRLKAAHGEAYSPLETKWGLPLYVLLHPADGFEQFRGRNLQSMRISAGLAALWFFLRVFDFFCAGFAFNPNRPVDYNIMTTLASTIAVFILFVIANLALSTFLDGKGRLREIIAVTAYSLIPMLSAMLVKTLLTNILTIEESAFLSIIIGIGYIWSGLLLLIGLSTVHQYTIKRTIVSIALTVLGVAIIALMLILTYTLILQCVGFVESIMYEWKIR